MMANKLTITIEIEGGSHKVKIKDSAGNEKEGNGCVVAVGNEATQDVYLFAWGHPKAASWALGEGLARSQGNLWWDGFINCHCRDMYFRSVGVEKVDPKDLLERWEKEDEERRSRHNG